MTTAYVINVTGEQQSQIKRLRKSIKDTESDIDLKIFRASTPATMEQDIKDMVCFDHNNWRWNWPMSPDEEGLDLQTGVYKKMYRASESTQGYCVCSIPYACLGGDHQGRPCVFSS